MDNAQEILLPYCRPSLRYRSRSHFLDEVKRIAKRQKGRLISAKSLEKASYQECLESVAQSLGHQSWHQLVHARHPENCESEVFLTTSLVEKYATRLDSVESAERSKCSVPSCTEPIAYKLFLFDYYKTAPTEIFLQPDHTCPYLCAAHAAYNEAKASGLRRPRWAMYYPFSNAEKPGKLGFNCYLPLGDSGRFKIFSWRPPTKSNTRDASFTDYIRKSLRAIDINTMNAELEEYIGDQLHAHAQRPMGVGTWSARRGDDGEVYSVERELDWQHFGIRWDDAPSYEKQGDGTYAVLITGTWVYAELDFYDQPPAMRLTGECFHRFVGKPRGEQLMELKFQESDADLSSAASFDWSTRDHRRGSDGSLRRIGSQRGESSGAGHGDGIGDGNVDGPGNLGGGSVGADGDGEGRVEALGSYIQNALEKIDFNKLNFALEDQILEGLTVLARGSRPHDDSTFWHGHEIEPTGLSINWKWDLNPFSTNNEDGTRDFFVEGTWRYVEVFPKELELEGECFHRFRGTPRLDAPLILEFIESDADLRSAEAEWSSDKRSKAKGKEGN